MRIDWNNLGSGLVSIAFGGLFLYQTYQLELERVRNVGGGMSAAAYPRLLASLIIILSGILIVKAIFNSLRSGEEKKETPVDFKALVKSAIVFVALVVYILILKPVGYLIATPILLIVIMFLTGERKWYYIVPTSILIPVILFVIIYYAFHILLPEGALGFLFG